MMVTDMTVTKWNLGVNHAYLKSSLTWTPGTTTKEALLGPALWADSDLNIFPRNRAARRAL